MSVQTNIEEYFCVICREILINPVTLPCNHTCCCTCLERTLECNKYQCFLCRKFIGSWYRNCKRRNTLVNEFMWKDINLKFPNLVEKKLKGESIDVLQSLCVTRLSSPGEIKEEFEIFSQKIRSEFQVEKEKEDQLSAEFIKQLQEEEMQMKKEEEEFLKTDEQVARELYTELNSVPQCDEDYLKFQLRMDEELARKLAADQNTHISLRSVDNKKKNVFFSRSKISSPKIEKSKKHVSHHSHSVTVGPLDRFLTGRTKK